MKPQSHSFRLTAKNRLAILEYSSLIGCTPAQFLNKFLDDFLVYQFTDPDDGTREEYICRRSFRSRKAAQRVVEWLHEAEKERTFPGWNLLKTNILEAPQGGYRIDAARFNKNGEMCRIS